MESMKLINLHQREEDFDRFSLAIQRLHELLLARQDSTDPCDRKFVYLIAEPTDRQLIRDTIIACVRQLYGSLVPVGILDFPTEESEGNTETLEEWVYRHDFYCINDVNLCFRLYTDPRGYVQDFFSGTERQSDSKLNLKARYLSISEVTHIRYGTSREYRARLKEAFRQ